MAKFVEIVATSDRSAACGSRCFIFLENIKYISETAAGKAIVHTKDGEELATVEEYETVRNRIELAFI